MLPFDWLSRSGLILACCHKIQESDRCILLYITIEGFGGKRALGILRKIELCQKRSKFRMLFCLGVLNNVLHVFSLELASFLRYYVCEKTHFFRGNPLGTF